MSEKEKFSSEVLGFYTGPALLRRRKYLEERRKFLEESRDANQLVLQVTYRPLLDGTVLTRRVINLKELSIKEFEALCRGELMEMQR